MTYISAQGAHRRQEIFETDRPKGEKENRDQEPAGNQGHERQTNPFLYNDERNRKGGARDIRMKK